MLLTCCCRVGELFTAAAGQREDALISALPVPVHYRLMLSKWPLSEHFALCYHVIDCVVQTVSSLLSAILLSHALQINFDSTRAITEQTTLTVVHALFCSFFIIFSFKNTMPPWSIVSWCAACLYNDVLGCCWGSQVCDVLKECC